MLVMCESQLWNQKVTHQPPFAFSRLSSPSFSGSNDGKTHLLAKPQKSHTNGLHLIGIVRPSTKQKMLKGLKENTCKVPINYLGNKGYFPPLYPSKAHYSLTH